MSIVDGISVTQQLKTALSGFRPILLKEMDEVHLLSRFDTKYVFHLSRLSEFLESLKSEYRVLTIDGLPLFGYENLYFDTRDLKSYHDHHNGRMTRYKVRFRKYTDSGKCYFELKLKTNKGLTEKQRLTTLNISKTLSETEREFLEKHLGEKGISLLPQITNKFSRITLVSEQRRERVTIDLLLHFKNGAAEKSLDELVIAEIKQESPSYDSPFKKLMQRERIFPTSISKYCIGTVLTHPGIKYNRFKPKLTILNKLCNGVE